MWWLNENSLCNECGELAAIPHEEASNEARAPICVDCADWFLGERDGLPTEQQEWTDYDPHC